MTSKAAAKSEPAFQWSDGVRVAGTQIWCDARRRPGSGAVCFVSHAHHPVAWPGSGRVRVLAHPRTLALASAPEAGDALPSAFGRPFALGRLRLELLPSGHVPGAAQLLVESPEARVLYAGDVNPRPGRVQVAAGESLQVRAADALLLEAPLAPLLRPLPPREEVEPRLIDAVRRALDEGVTPVVRVERLGGAGEVAALLLAAGIAVRAHRRIGGYLSLYERLGIPLGGALPQFREGAGDAALLWPLDADRDPPLPKIRRILAAGEALDPERARRHDEAFALSDHGDLPSLLELAASIGARDVWLTAGLTDEVAAAFRAKKFRVHALAPPAQMQLV